MQFLRIFVWLVIALLLLIFAYGNWSDVTVNLWGHLQADVKLPVLLLIAWALGFVPPWLILRAQLWQARRKLVLQQQLAAAELPEPAPGANPGN
jgi:lipopolysaccharide assembly protein A